MRKQSTSIAMVVLAIGLSAGALAAFAEAATGAVAADQPSITGQAQTACPVMGNPIDKKLYADYKGKRVFFCCGMCPKMFAKDPEKYMKKLAADGIVLEDSPAGAQANEKGDTHE
jgi:YHS domain-containing protein